MKPGDIVLLWFPFSHTETTPYKKRPVLVLGASGANGADEAYLVAMITSSADRVANPRQFDIQITGWTEAGLLGPSVCRAVRLWTAERRDVDRVIGSVTGECLTEVLSTVKRTFAI